MAHFEAELRALKSRASALKVNIGTGDEMAALRSDTVVRGRCVCLCV